MFDIDGTLVESTAFDDFCYTEAIEHTLHIQIDDTWASYKNITDTGLLQEILERNSINTHIDEVITDVKQHFLPLVKIFSTPMV